MVTGLGGLSMSSSGPVESLSVGGDVALPFACRHPDGAGTPEIVLKPRAIQCALSRICGVCGSTLARPVAFVGPVAEVQSGVLEFPPLHRGCAEGLAAARGWAGLTTPAFDLVRPARRGGIVTFRPGEVLERFAGD